MNLLPQLCLILTFSTSHYETRSTAICATIILYLFLWSSFNSSLWCWNSVHYIMKLLPLLCVLLTLCSCHYEASSTALCATVRFYLSLWKSFHNFCATDILYLLLWSSSTALCATDILYLSLWSYFQSSVWYWHSVPLIMKLLPQLCVLLSYCTCHYEVTSTALCATDILYLSLWSSFQISVCYWHSVPLFMKLFPQLCVLLTFGACHYDATSTSLCAIVILYLLIWSSIHISMCYWHSIPVIMNFLPELCVLLTFSSCHCEAPSTALCAPDSLYLSLWNSFHSTVCFWLSVPVIMKLLPQLCVLLTFFSCNYVSPSSALCVSDILYLSLWNSFQSSVC